MSLLQREQAKARLRTLRVIEEAGRLVVRPKVLCDPELPAWHRLIPKTVLT